MEVRWQSLYIKTAIRRYNEHTVYKAHCPIPAIIGHWIIGRDQCAFLQVTYRPKNYVGYKCLAMSVPGVRPLGRSRKRWFDVVMQNMRANGITTEDVIVE